MQEQLRNASWKFLSKSEADVECSSSRRAEEERSSDFVARREFILTENLSEAPVSVRVVGLQTILAVSMEALRRYVVRIIIIIVLTSPNKTPCG